MNRSPAAILYDSYGNPIGTVLDGAAYRLQMETTLKVGCPLYVTYRIQLTL